MSQIIPPSPVDSPFGSYNWADWYEKVRRAINNSQGTIAVGQGGTGITSYAIGDMLYASATNILQSLHIGAAGAILTSSGTAPQWTTILPKANGGTGTATPALVAGTNVTITGSWPNQTINAAGGGGTLSSFRMHLAADAVGVAGSTTNFILWDTIDFDTASVCNAATHTITPTAGTWMIGAQQEVTSSAGFGQCLIYKNSTLAGNGNYGAGDGTFMKHIAHDTIQFNGTDVLKIAFYSSSTPTVKLGSANTYVFGVKIA